MTAGAWSVNVTALQAQALADGSYSIKANVSDVAGNAATTATQAIVVDETIPTIAITSPVAGDNIINKTEAAAGFTISGTAAPGSAGVNGQTATITIVDSTNVVKDTYTTTVTAGAWSVNVTALQAQALPTAATASRPMSRMRPAMPPPPRRRRSRSTRPRRRLRSQARLPATTSSTRPRRQPASPSAARLCRRRRGGGQRPDRDDHDRRRHQRRQGHLYDDRHRRRMVGQRNGAAGTSAGRRQLQHQGERLGCGRQCRDHRDAGDHGGRNRADDRDHKPDCRRQHHQQDRGGSGCRHQRHGDSRHRRCGGQWPDRDDHACR